MLFRAVDALALLASKGSGRLSAGSGSCVSWRKVRANGGVVRIGSNCIVHARIDLDSATGEVTIGNRVYIGASHIICHTRVDIGDDAIISWDVTIVDHDSHSLDAATRRDDVMHWGGGRKSWSGVNISPVTIGRHSWIGFGATILKGVTVGEGAVVGAKSVVTRDVPPRCLVAGNPARIIRTLSDGSPATDALE